MLADHIAEMRATSPPESVHALDLDGLSAPSVTVWTMWEGSTVLGCAALKELSPSEGEIKSMRTSSAARGRGVAGRMLAHLMEEARTRGYRRLSLETGAEEFFAPARRLYARHGFTECAPFAEYDPDPLSVFMTREL
nr:GNAT family N-acetyltransferase [Microcella alkalica]